VVVVIETVAAVVEVIDTVVGVVELVVDVVTTRLLKVRGATSMIICEISKPRLVRACVKEVGSSEALRSTALSDRGSISASYFRMYASRL
jgi:hypothetical protein